MHMATAAHAPDAAAPAPKGKKKLIIVVVAALLVLGIGGGAAVFMMKKKAAEAEAAAAEADGEDGGGHAKAKAAAPVHAPPAKDAHAPPVFVPLEPFVVNLADRDSDRFAQIGVTLEVDDAKFAEQMKLYMPAIRNNILLVLAHKTAAQLLDRAGKEALAAEIMRESVRPMGIEIEADEDEEAGADKAATDDEAKPKKKKKKRKPPVYNPVRSVNFSNFIIQ